MVKITFEIRIEEYFRSFLENKYVNKYDEKSVVPPFLTPTVDYR